MDTKIASLFWPMTSACHFFAAPPAPLEPLWLDTKLLSAAYDGTAWLWHLKLVLCMVLRIPSEMRLPQQEVERTACKSYFLCTYLAVSMGNMLMFWSFSLPSSPSTFPATAESPRKGEAGIQPHTGIHSSWFSLPPSPPPANPLLLVCKNWVRKQSFMVSLRSYTTCFFSCNFLGLISHFFYKGTCCCYATANVPKRREEGEREWGRQRHRETLGKAENPHIVQGSIWCTDIYRGVSKWGGENDANVIPIIPQSSALKQPPSLLPLYT